MKRRSSAARKAVLNFDFSSWNFIVFLALAFLLIVFVALALSNTAADLSAKAGITCPRITALPRPEACPGGSWQFKRDTNGCSTFFCEPSSVSPTPRLQTCIPRPACLDRKPRCVIAEPAQGWCYPDPVVVPMEK